MDPVDQLMAVTVFGQGEDVLDTEGEPSSRPADVTRLPSWPRQSGAAGKPRWRASACIALPRPGDVFLGCPDGLRGLIDVLD